MTQPPLPPQRLQPPRHVPYYAIAAVSVSVGVALAVVRPWQHDPAPLAVSPVARASAPQTATPRPDEQPAGPVLEHTYVEKFLVDLEDATAPVCNGGKDVAAKVGRVLTCVEKAQKWTVRITEVDPDGGVRWELAD